MKIIYNLLLNIAVKKTKKDKKKKKKLVRAQCTSLLGSKPIHGIAWKLNVGHLHLHIFVILIRVSSKIKCIFIDFANCTYQRQHFSATLTKNVLTSTL